MFYQVIHLKDFFPQLGIESIDAMCSQREADLIVYHFLPIDIFCLKVYTMDIQSERRRWVCRHR